jgi:type IV pilus assembly protein PilY1
MLFRKLGFVVAQIVLGMYGLQAFAATVALSDVPVYLTQPMPPMVMLNISRDHQLFYKAYNDFSDLDSDGARETTYKHTFDYYGYFDSYKCYTYGSGQFNPSADASATKYCDGATWSGNFLNWVSMSRLDILRKVLYGGKRSTDTATLTVLERAPLPTDAHSWAKYYNGADINQLTPFSSPTAAPVYTGTVNNVSSNKPIRVTGITGEFFAGDQIRVVKGANIFSAVVTAYAGTTLDISTNVDSAALTGTFATNDAVSVTNYSRTGISFCNSTIDTANNFSQTTTQPPVIRVAKGNYALWSANERWQCYWYGEKSGSDDINAAQSTNANQYLVTGLAASRRNPPSTTFTGTTEFIARVKVCDSSLLGHENCRDYGNSKKPAGLLQRDGEGATPQLLFGMMMGTYSRNISGGVLRKNLGKSLSGNAAASDDEINPADGTLTSTFGIIQALDSLKMYGYAYGSGDGIYNNNDGCSWQLAGISPFGTTVGTAKVGEGNCVSWGNPLSEIYLESLRYLAGKTADPRFSATYAGSKDETIFGTGHGPVSWGSPLNSTNYCTPLNVLVFNASVSSYDNDQMNLFSDLSPTSGVTAASKTKDVGDLEGITSPTALSAPIGSNGTTSDNACTAKSITNLGLVNGICPEAPMQLGTFLIAGTAYYAHTNRIRTDLTVPAADTTSLKVKTYGIALATNVPRIEVTVAGSKVSIIPAFNQDLGGGIFGPGTIVDFKVISETPGVSGSYYVNWEDSAQGGDYDQDVSGIISYVISGSNITITTRTFASSTGGSPMGFGYAISGTNRAGVHYHSGINGFTYADATGATACSGSCNVGAAATSSTYTVGSTSGLTSLKDPLYYAAKFGGFKDSNGNSQPDLTTEWDADGDGSPDTFYYVNNPSTLENSLNKAFVDLATTSSAASVVTNFNTLRVGSVAYQATYNPKDWTGSVTAYSIDPTTAAFTFKWDAAAVVPIATSRVIMSYDSTSTASSGGIPFRFTSLNATQQGLLTNASKVDYLRGDASNEGTATGKFRVRTSRLGDSIDSSPAYVGVPAGQYSDPGRYGFSYTESAYYTFVNDNRSRTAVVYAGGNDGMLHGFRASDGVELVAYVPNVVMGNLPLLTQAGYSHKFFVDGSPEIADAKISSTWKTILVGGLRAGGRGVYALDVTDPTAFAESTASSVVIGEFDAATDSDIGYVYGQPQIVQLNNGKWAVLIGNGYNNGSGKSMLFLIYLQKTGNRWTASDYLKMTTGVGSTTDPNGLAGVKAVDLDGDGKVDVAYAGDLHGNLWKFTLSSANLTAATPSSLPTSGASSGVTKLISACTDNSTTCPAAKRQAITHTPEVSSHPNGTDYLVYFGTGSDLDKTDLLDSRTQSVYGIWDRSGALVNRSQLLSQTISTYTPTAAVTVDARNVTQTAIDWTISTTTGLPVHMGWVENLPASGERMVGDPTLNSGFLFYNTYISSANPCDMGGYGYLMAVAYQNGGKPTLTLWDSNGDGVINGSDAPVGGIRVDTVASSSIIGTTGSSGYALAISSLVHPISTSSSGSSAAGSAGSAASTSAASTSSGSSASASSGSASSGSGSSSGGGSGTTPAPIGTAGATTFKDAIGAALGIPSGSGIQTISVLLIKLPSGAARLGWKEMRSQ